MLKLRLKTFRSQPQLSYNQNSINVFHSNSHYFPFQWHLQLLLQHKTFNVILKSIVNTNLAVSFDPFKLVKFFPHSFISRFFSDKSTFLPWNTKVVQYVETKSFFCANAFKEILFDCSSHYAQMLSFKFYGKHSDINTSHCFTMSHFFTSFSSITVVFPFTICIKYS